MLKLQFYHSLPEIGYESGLKADVVPIYELDVPITSSKIFFHCTRDYRIPSEKVNEIWDEFVKEKSKNPNFRDGILYGTPENFVFSKNGIDVYGHRVRWSQHAVTKDFDSSHVREMVLKYGLNSLPRIIGSNNACIFEDDTLIIEKRKGTGFYPDCYQLRGSETWTSAHGNTLADVIAKGCEKELGLKRGTDFNLNEIKTDFIGASAVDYHWETGNRVDVKLTSKEWVTENKDKMTEEYFARLYIVPIDKLPYFLATQKRRELEERGLLNWVPEAVKTDEFLNTVSWVGAGAYQAYNLYVDYACNGDENEARRRIDKVYHFGRPEPSSKFKVVER